MRAFPPALRLQSYEETDLWDLIAAPPEGLKLNFVRAERSNFRWEGSDQDRLETSGARVHLLDNAGHWVHTDNPEGLFQMMHGSFARVGGGIEEAYSQRGRAGLQ